MSPSHPVRRWFILFCVSDYLRAKFDPEFHDSPFEYQKELNSIPEFAAQLLDAVATAMAQPRTRDLDISIPSAIFEGVNITIRSKNYDERKKKLGNEGKAEFSSLQRTWYPISGK